VTCQTFAEAAEAAAACNGHARAGAAMDGQFSEQLRSDSGTGGSNCRWRDSRSHAGRVCVRGAVAQRCTFLPPNLFERIIDKIAQLQSDGKIARTSRHDAARWRVNVSIALTIVTRRLSKRFNGSAWDEEELNRACFIGRRVTRSRCASRERESVVEATIWSDTC
jgi:hypothetical protein